MTSVSSKWKKNRPLVTAAAGIIGIALLLLSFSSVKDQPALAVGKPAPPFELADLSGRMIKLSDYQGKVLLVDFWATWCVTCEKEVPELKALYKEFKGSSFDILAASVDQGTPGVVAKFVSENKLPYPVVFAVGETVNAYNVFGLPAKFLIDENGHLYRKYSAEDPVSEVIKDLRILLKRRTG